LVLEFSDGVGDQCFGFSESSFGFGQQIAGVGDQNFGCGELSFCSGQQYAGSGEQGAGCGEQINGFGI